MFNTILFSCPSNSEESLPEFSNRIIQNVDFPVFIHQPVKRSQSYNYFNYQVKANLDRDKRRASVLVDELLMDIYNPHSSNNNNTTTDYYSGSGKSHKSCIIETDVNWHREKDKKELIKILNKLHEYIEHTGSVLVRQLKRRDALWRQQESVCSVITKVLLQHSYGASSEGINMRFTIQPNPGESGFDQWVAAMKMVAQLPGGIPSEFRRRLWITMAEKHLASRGIEWSQVEKTCFSEWSHPTDAELGIQIVKDLHRTGCSLFCGENGQENQALLKKVLLAYARWNKAVGYCQGFNMLAALILQVTDCSESDTLKLMIYLIEGVLPDSYFADSLRGLSVDMAVFRELLRSKLPRLSKHLDLLQNSSKDGCKSYEPPLTNVFTMQWFLTLFCNCLPQPTVLRVWDLIFLEGNEILLRTALAIWQVLAQRILALKTADEFYCAMGSLTNELLESNLIDANTLIKAIVNVGSLAELKNLRDHYLYNITPWGSSAIPRAPEKRIIKQSIPLDISSLKKQYVKLKQRQRQAHVIFSSAISRQPPPAASTTTTPPSIAINHLLIGKKSLGTNKRTGPAKGTIPPPRQIHPSTIHWKNAEKKCSSSSSSDTELCDEDDVQSSVSSEDEKSAPENSDVNKDTLMPPSIADLKLTSDSEDESCSVDFENFLADRVKCFKENNHTNNNEDSLEDESQINDDYTIRRNSAMALQIIQENSLILHKIMQCQSRLSPSPPPPLLLFNSADDESEKVNSNTRMDNVNSWIENNEIELFNNDDDKISVDLSSEKIESRFHHILEKSKSLDERYNNLFRLSSSTIHESKSDTPVGSGTTIILESSASSNRDDDNDENALKENPNSSKLIQENLDLLKAFSANKAKKQREKLIEENVHLLKSISLEKCCTNNKSVTEENDGEILQINVEVDEHTEGENLKIEEIQNNSPTLSNPLIIFDEDNNKSMENIPNICCDNESAISSDNGQSLTIINKKFFSVMEENSSETDDRSSSSPSISKSPSRTFNPFPISHNSRQSKEVPLKLGLYKK